MIKLDGEKFEDKIDRYYQVMVYGLADAPRGWYNVMSALIMLEGYLKSIYDPCLFYWREEEEKIEGEEFILLALTTDDLLEVQTDTPKAEKKLAELHAAMRKEWEIKTEEQVTSILGTKIQYNEDQSATLTMPLKIEEIKKRFFPNMNIEDEPEIYEPMPIWWREEESDRSPAYDAITYLQGYGLLLWMIRVRPEADFAVSKLGTRSHACTEYDAEALKHLAAFFITTRILGRTFHWGGIQAELEIEAASDATYRRFIANS
jgi:hypothetical protein